MIQHGLDSRSRRVFPARLLHGMFTCRGEMVGSDAYSGEVDMMIDTGAETSVAIGGRNREWEVRLKDEKGRMVEFDHVFFISPEKGGEGMFRTMVLLGMNFIARLNAVLFDFTPGKLEFVINPGPVHGKKVPVFITDQSGRDKSIKRMMRANQLVPLLEVSEEADPACRCRNSGVCELAFEVRKVIDTGSAVTTANTDHARDIVNNQLEFVDDGISIQRWTGKKVNFARLKDTCTTMANDVRMEKVQLQVPHTQYSDYSFMGTDYMSGLPRLGFANLHNLLENPPEPPTLYIPPMD